MPTWTSSRAGNRVAPHITIPDVPNLKESTRKMTKYQLAMAICLALIIPACIFAASDLTVSKTPVMYRPTADDLAYPKGLESTGDVAEADVAVVGTALQYSGVVINTGTTDGGFPFIKVQQQNYTGAFEYGACYLGNNGGYGNFGLGFFPLTQTFHTGHLKASRSGSDVIISITNIDGGTKPN